MTTSLEQTTLAVEGMTCSACVNAIERALNSIDGVKASVNFGSETVHILAPAEINPKVFIQKIKDAGYSASPLGDSSHISMHNKKSAIALFFAALFAIPAIAISMTMSWHHSIDMWIHDTLDLFGILHPTYSPTAWLVIALTAPVVLFVAWPIHRAALRNLMHPTMDNLVNIVVDQKINMTSAAVQSPDITLIA